MGNPLKIIEKPFGRLGRTEGDPGGTDPEGGGVGGVGGVQ